MSEERAKYWDGAIAIDVDAYDTFVQGTWMNHSREQRYQIGIAALGLAGESGEVAEKIKKYLRGDYLLVEGRDIEVLKELGDILYYISTMARLLGYSLNAVMGLNMDKLSEREQRTGTLRGDGDNR